MKHKVSELEGALLDVAVVVALAGGVAVARLTYRCSDQTYVIGRDVCYGPDGEHFHPSTDWADGGPIIERERIALRYTSDGYWNASAWVGKEAIGTDGLTPLIAAMRAYVASKLGEEVELP